MNNKSSSVSNKNNSGKGNGNSIIKNKSTNDTSTNYVSGEVPTSTAHKFKSSTQNGDDKLE